MVSKDKTVTVGWFEIPVRNMDRAMHFYSQVFNVTLDKQDFGGLLMAWFPWDASGKGAGGSLVKNENYVPSHDGALIYFSSIDVETEINRVEEAGGKVLQERTEISPEIGFMGLFEDTEGNRVALHSRQ